MVDYDRIRELRIDEWVWWLFIGLSFFNIIGDEFEKDYCTYHSIGKKLISHDIFTFTIFASLLIYLYLEYHRFEKIGDLKRKGVNASLWEIRSLGGFLVCVATVLFLYCQIVDFDFVNPQIV